MRSLETRFKISLGVKRHHAKKRGGENKSNKARFDINHSLWRQAVIEKDFGICQRCGGEGDQAHHVHPYDTHPELRYVIQNGIALCRSCHNKMHPMTEERRAKISAGLRAFHAAKRAASGSQGN